VSGGLLGSVLPAQEPGGFARHWSDMKTHLGARVGAPAGRRRRKWPWLVALVVSAAAGGSCDGTVTGPEGETAVVSIEVTPAFGRLLFAGDSIRYAATAHLADGSARSVSPDWTSTDAAVATIAADGWAFAHSDGVVVLNATLDSIVASAVLLINSDTEAPTLETVFVDRTLVNIFQRAGVIELRAEFIDRDSGVSRALAVFDGPFGASITGVVDLSPLPADSTDGATQTDGARVFTGLLQIPANAGVGLWTLSTLSADDRARNSARWSARELADLGFEVTVQAVLSGN
jgi:hypothetical protein